MVEQIVPSRPSFIIYRVFIPDNHFGWKRPGHQHTRGLINRINGHTVILTIFSGSKKVVSLSVMRAGFRKIYIGDL